MENISQMLNKSHITLLLLAAGNGERLGNQPKAFLRYNHQSLLEYVVEKFQPFVDEMIIGIGQNFLAEARGLLNDNKIKIIAGGDSRHATLCQLLSHATTPWVLVHDVARPFVSAQLIRSILDAASGPHVAIANAVLVPRRDTLVIKNDESNLHQCLTENIYAIQTPQLYNREILGSCCAQEVPIAYTRSAVSLLNFCNVPVYLIDGEDTNIKITYPEDLMLIQNN